MILFIVLFVKIQLPDRYVTLIPVIELIPPVILEKVLLVTTLVDALVPNPSVLFIPVKVLAPVSVIFEKLLRL